MSVPADSATREKILTVGESLFATYGYDNVSLRSITTKAGVNLAAVNYHFYDKESLFREILGRCLFETNNRRLKLLAAAERNAVNGIVPLAVLMDALARPLFLTPDGRSNLGGRLVGRLLLDSQPFTNALLQSDFQPIMTRFGQLIRRHLRGISPSDFLWRFSFIMGALHHSLLTLHNMKNLTQGICGNDDAETALANFTKFATLSFQEFE